VSIVDSACETYPEACRKASAASIKIAQQTIAASKVVVDAIQYDHIESATTKSIQHLGDFTSKGSDFIHDNVSPPTRKLWGCLIGILGTGLVSYATLPLLFNIIGLTIRGPLTRSLFGAFQAWGWVKKGSFLSLVQSMAMGGSTSFSSYFLLYVGMQNIGVAIAILEYYLDCWTAIKCEITTCSDPYGFAA
jgi:hypothetical protein